MHKSCETLIIDLRTARQWAENIKQHFGQLELEPNGISNSAPPSKNE